MIPARALLVASVSCELTALHFDPHMDEGWHEHTWTVTVWRRGEPFTDGRSAREALQALLHSIAPFNEYDVRQLPPELWSNEAIARTVAVLGNVIEVEVSRDGFGARLVL